MNKAEIKIYMPSYSRPRKRYYEVYVKYLLNFFNQLGAEVHCDTRIDSDGRFVMGVNGRRVFMDYSDHPAISKLWDRKIPYFKFHCHQKFIHTNKIFPFPPISFYDWGQFRRLQKSIQYRAIGDVIVNKQKPYGNALKRRKLVRSTLRKKYGKNVDIKPDSPQLTFWNRIKDCLVAVFVPGAYNNMLDRGHFQYIGFGCCTISPRIDDLLSFNKLLIPGTHYILCKDDYSDLIEVIEWCKSHRTDCIHIGQNAKALFNKTSVPSMTWKWMQHVISKTS